MNEKFNVVLTEMCADETAKNNSLFRIPKYVAFQQTRNGQRGRGVCFVIRKGKNFNVLANAVSNAQIFLKNLQKLTIRTLKTLIIPGLHKTCAWIR